MPKEHIVKKALAIYHPYKKEKEKAEKRAALEDELIKLDEEQTLCKYPYPTQPRRKCGAPRRPNKPYCWKHWEDEEKRLAKQPSAEKRTIAQQWINDAALEDDEDDEEEQDLLITDINPSTRSIPSPVIRTTAQRQGSSTAQESLNRVAGLAPSDIAQSLRGLPRDINDPDVQRVLNRLPRDYAEGFRRAISSGNEAEIGNLMAGLHVNSTPEELD